MSHAHVSRREPLAEEVTSCDDCPFSVARLPLYGDAAAFWCNHGALGPEAVAKKTPGGHAPPPEWCPLRWGPTLVRLKVTR